MCIFRNVNIDRLGHINGYATNMCFRCYFTRSDMLTNQMTKNILKCMWNDSTILLEVNHSGITWLTGDTLRFNNVQFLTASNVSIMLVKMCCQS